MRSVTGRRRRTLHVGLRRAFFGNLRAVAVTSFLKKRRTLGARKHRQSRVRQHVRQLCSLLAFGGAVHVVLQQPGSEGVALHVQHRAGAVTGGRRAVEIGSILAASSTCIFGDLGKRHCDEKSYTHTSQSTARISEMSVVGRPTASRMMARVNTPPAGIPAAPTLEAVAVTLAKRRARIK